jgi:Myosin head (motor domain)
LTSSISLQLFSTLAISPLSRPELTTLLCLTPLKPNVCAHLLGIPVPEFTCAILHPCVLAGREWVSQARTRQQALNELSALCKTLYEKSFGQLIDWINHALDCPSSKSTFIGVLDIAGFEIFETNTFRVRWVTWIVGDLVLERSCRVRTRARPQSPMRPRSTARPPNPQGGRGCSSRSRWLSYV